MELLQPLPPADLTRREADLALRHRPPNSGDYYVAKLGTFAVAVYRRRGNDTDAWVAYTEEQSQGQSHEQARWVQRQGDETGMPVFSAESPLTCVVFGSGQALDHLDKLARTSRNRRPSLTPDWRTS